MHFWPDFGPVEKLFGEAITPAARHKHQTLHWCCCLAATCEASFSAQLLNPGADFSWCPNSAGPWWHQAAQWGNSGEAQKPHQPRAAAAASTREFLDNSQFRWRRLSAGWRRFCEGGGAQPFWWGVGGCWGGRAPIHPTTPPTEP